MYLAKVRESDGSAVCGDQTHMAAIIDERQVPGSQDVKTDPVLRKQRRGGLNKLFELGADFAAALHQIDLFGCCQILKKIRFSAFNKGLDGSRNRISKQGPVQNDKRGRYQQVAIAFREFFVRLITFPCTSHQFGHTLTVRMSINLENKPGLSSFNQEDWTFGTIVDQFCPVSGKRKSFTAAQPSAESL
jgi:hypothetical protein